MVMKTKTALRVIGQTFKRLRQDRQGVGAVEFAIIFPVLLALYITAFELTIGFSVYKRATHAAGTIADLVSQQVSVNKAYLKTMPDVASAIFVPYATTGLDLKISGIQVDANRVARINWSWSQSNQRPYPANSVVNLPDNLRQPNAFLVHAELTIPHTLLMFLSNAAPSIRQITIGRDYYFAKREQDPITCTDC